MNLLFAETLRRLRTERGLSQKQLGEQLFVYHSTISRWENGSRLPDAAMIPRLAKCLDVDANTLFHFAEKSDEIPQIIIVDDNEVILAHGLSVLETVLPDASVTGFTSSVEAIEYAKMNCVALAMLDIELGRSSGLELCNRLVEINSCTNIVFLTAYADYSLDAWKTDASGFMLKPLTPESVKEQMKKLRYPFWTCSAYE